MILCKVWDYLFICPFLQFQFAFKFPASFSHEREREREREHAVGLSLSVSVATHWIESLPCSTRRRRRRSEESNSREGMQRRRLRSAMAAILPMLLVFAVATVFLVTLLDANVDVSASSSSLSAASFYEVSPVLLLPFFFPPFLNRHRCLWTESPLSRYSVSVDLPFEFLVSPFGWICALVLYIALPFFPLDSRCRKGLIVRWNTHLHFAYRVLGEDILGN